MIYSLWRVSIGECYAMHAMPCAEMHHYDRDGQKRPVYIYRFLTTGTIDGMFRHASYSPLTEMRMSQRKYTSDKSPS